MSAITSKEGLEAEAAALNLFWAKNGLQAGIEVVPDGDGGYKLSSDGRMIDGVPKAIHRPHCRTVTDKVVVDLYNGANTYGIEGPYRLRNAAAAAADRLSRLPRSSRRPR